MTEERNEPSFSPRGKDLNPRDQLVVDIKKKIAEHEQDGCCGLRSQRSFAITDTLEAMLNSIMQKKPEIFETFQREHKTKFDLAITPIGCFFKDNSISELRGRFAVNGVPSPAMSRGPSLIIRAT